MLDRQSEQINTKVQVSIEEIKVKVVYTFIWFLIVRQLHSEEL